MNLKQKLCNELINKGMVKEFDVIEHNYNWGGDRPLEKTHIYDDNISPTITTRPDTLGVVMNEVRKLGSYKPSGFNASQVLDAEGISPTVMNNNGEVNAVIEGIKIKNNTKQGYLVANEYDGLDLETRKGRRGTVQKGMSQTINTQDNKGVVVVGGIGEKKSNGGTQWYQQDRVYDDKVALSVTTTANPYYKNELRIRKLTEKECFRLMGVKNSDYDKISTNKSQKYKMAGNSIVVQVLMGIFGKLCGLTDEYIESKIIESVEEVRETDGV